jgi:peptide methionine sulfoxide reductase MsrA
MGTEERSGIYTHKPNKGIFKATKELRDKYNSQIVTEIKQAKKPAREQTFIGY